jgi:hypothetical protein
MGRDLRLNRRPFDAWDRFIGMKIRQRDRRPFLKGGCSTKGVVCVESRSKMAYPKLRIAVASSTYISKMV